MQKQKSTVLSVDDDKDLQLVLRQHLEDDGYQVVDAFSGKQLEERLFSGHHDVILLDLGLPDTQGLSLISTIRAKTKTPIIIVSGKTDTMEKVVGLEMGADDYITKPFEMRELSARIRAVLRRTAAEAPAAAPAANDKVAERVTFSTWYLDRTQYQAFDKKNQSMNLTTGEFKLLDVLVASCNKAVSREQLYDRTRQDGYDTYDRAIDIQIARIRKKMGDDTKTPTMIKTIRGVGYMLCDQPEK